MAPACRMAMLAELATIKRPAKPSHAEDYDDKDEEERTELLLMESSWESSCRSIHLASPIRSKGHPSLPKPHWAISLTFQLPALLL